MVDLSIVFVCLPEGILWKSPWKSPWKSSANHHAIWRPMPILQRRPLTALDAIVATRPRGRLGWWISPRHLTGGESDSDEWPIAKRQPRCLANSLFSCAFSSACCLYSSHQCWPIDRHCHAAWDLNSSSNAGTTAWEKATEKNATILSPTGTLKTSFSPRKIWKVPF